MIYPIQKFDPASFNGLKVQNFGGPSCGDPPNLALPIPASQNSSLISSIAQTLNAVRLEV